MNLYAVLNVAKNATRDAIRAAFRAKAKAVHPDLGGDPKAFDQLKLAYDVLSDEAKRSHYDETGEVQTVSPEAMLRATAVRIIGQLIMEAAVRPDNATNEDLQELYCSSLRVRITTLKQQIAQLDIGIKRAEDMRGRWSTNEEVNLLEDVVNAQLRELERVRRNVVGQIEAHDLAISILEQYKFKYDPQHQVYYNGHVFYSAVGSNINP